MWPLTRRGPAAACTPTKLVISAKRASRRPTLPAHEGHDWLYVLSGRMRLVLGDEDLVIEPGEAVEFSTWTPHGSAPTRRPARYKRLDQVLAAHGDTIEIVHRLTPLGVAMAGADDV